MLVVGLMSGTSLDGIDASLVKIDGFGTSTKIKVIKSISLPYEQTLKEELLSAMDKKSSNVEQICSLNFKLGYLFADAVKKVCKEADIPLSQIDLIGSHGQTIYHLPNPLPPLTKSSLQIGDPSVLAYETKTMVVSNFRAMDIAAGGEGAPLIPYIDWLLFRSKTKGRILQNIGGIGNCTVLKKDAKKEDIIAFDTGPGNMIIDELCRTLLNIPYDANGEIASQGKVHHDVVSKLMDHDFFKKSPPKSTGREEFGREFTLKVIKNFSDLSAKDLIATATYFTAYSIADAYKKFVFPEAEIDEIIVSGGGGNNKTLLKMIQSLLPDKKLIKMDDLGITADEKEAVGFAVLANEYIHQQKTNMPKATGAKEFVLLGQLTLPPYGDQKRLLAKTLLP
ncbi:MAG: anhydro-N-acetylmuramic acid kinase [Caldibacillus debilis]|uniref:Anhydro-N-acetylmuramic acid kinase n=1 Tax=Caldibacillus debilis TaxID=301148 RepID=A0A3E0K578_9BACI|nr:anhydro-N-acetylmuramic acid kinase AnmK [Caldibacillus debilis]REJ28390.1 MAG: anhydro-N-acetylmuramic acid kinase [Caldibacillus debilis]